MAYKICQFIATNNLSDLPANRNFSPIFGTNVNMFPENKDVLLKKIAVDCVYNSSGDIGILDYSLSIIFLERSQIQIRNNRFILVNPVGFINQGNNQFITINKECPIQNINILCSGFHFSSNVLMRNEIVLTNNTSVITSNVSLLISAYYED